MLGVECWLLNVFPAILLRLTGRGRLLHSASIQMRFLLAILVVAIGFLSSVSSKAEPQMANGIKVIVHDSIVTYQQVEDNTTPLIDDLRRQTMMGKRDRQRLADKPAAGDQDIAAQYFAHAAALLRPGALGKRAGAPGSPARRAPLDDESAPCAYRRG